jgi:GTP-binding protein HflX
MALIERHRRETVVLVGVAIPPVSVDEAEASLEELAALADTAGADEAERVLQRRHEPDAATFVGKGKAEELRDISNTVDADTVIFDDELSPAQSRNLEKILGRTAIDRTALILDIFAQHAHTPAGKAQVELAMLRYRLPRLRGKGKGLSQQAGGIGTRMGGGETKLEVDRRRLLRRVTKLEEELKELTKNRQTQRKARARSRLPTVTIVGYTNAGKSTLLNRLTDAGVLVQDRLFATVDPTTRRLELPGGERVLVTDTVGFVKKLPHQLVQAFRSTLDEVAEADLLLHVVDASTPDPRAHMDAVRAVLREIGADDVPELIVFNKSDLIGSTSADPDDAKRLLQSHPGSVLLSAETGEGIDRLLDVIGERLREMTHVVELVVPYDRGDVVAAVHRAGEVVSESHDEDATRMWARIRPEDLGRFREFVA